jgi:fluoride exporter
MLIQCLLVGLGGSIGAVLRYLIENWAAELSKLLNFPFGTFAANILGCLLIGFLFGIISISNVISSRAKLFLITGFLGGLTTFSLFDLEIFEFILKSELIMALLNAFIQVIVGLFAVWVGFIAANILAKKFYYKRLSD